MKKRLFAILILFIFMPYLSSAISCLSSSEDYAVEAVIPDYNTINLRKISDYNDGVFYITTQYDVNLIGLIKETSFPDGLSVRLQIPTELTEIKKPYFKFISTIEGKKIIDIKTTFLAGWSILCSENTCVFSKEGKKLTLRQLPLEVEATVEISEELNSCSQGCGGVCIAVASDTKCIASKAKNDFNMVLRFAGVAQQFEELLESYQIAGSSEIILTDVNPSYNPYIDWQEAMRQELVYLDSKNIISIFREDIESIALLSKRGQAGQNQRIVYDFENDIWTYYNKISSPVLSTQRECVEYQRPKNLNTPITGNIIGLAKNPFYLIPLVILVAGLFAFIILILIARAITSRQKTYSDKVKTT